MPSFEINWEAPEFQYREKEVSWYWISIIVAAAIIAFAIWERNFLFGVFIVIAEILFISWGNEEPRVVLFKLTEHELSIGETKNYQLDLMESFSTNELTEEWTELVFSFKSKFKTPIMMIAPKTTLDDIRKNLKPLLREVPYEPSLIDSLEKIIGF